MQTIADEHKNEAARLISKAIGELSAIVVEECSGSDDYTEQFLETLRQAFYQLIALRTSLR